MDTLTAKIENGILVLTLANVAHGNSFGQAEADQLARALQRHKGQFEGVLFLSASPRFFCTGGNLSFYASLKGRMQGLRANLRIRQVLQKLNSLPEPKVAVVAGDCFGGGMEVLSVFDHVVATPEAQLGFWQRRLSLTFGWGGGGRWEKKMGTGAMLKAMIEARTYSSYEARQLGLVQEIVLRNRAEASGRAWLEKAMRWPREPLKNLRSWNSLREVKIFEGLWLNPSHKRVLERFKKAMG
ncbi:MAG: enoyl-CoA hydratase/isomerase family protein [Bdellovibrionales bacterium]|nr:enoyl-CoA hydratase/isomerase family protein [Bdellovibrionales bacterium]